MRPWLSALGVLGALVVAGCHSMLSFQPPPAKPDAGWTPIEQGLSWPEAGLETSVGWTEGGIVKQDTGGVTKDAGVKKDGAAKKDAVKADACKPVCTGKLCGAANGCGLTCQAGSGCCTPSCGGKTCGSSDGCGGTCSQGSGCVCSPSCSGAVCGAKDGCGNVCSSDDNQDPCTTPDQWRCVKSEAIWPGSTISQVCQGGMWRTYNINVKDCASCCGAFSVACTQ